MWNEFQDSLQETRPPEALQTVAKHEDFLEEDKFHYQIEIFLHLFFLTKFIIFTDFR
jgi:hypothetical protein